MAQTTNPLPGPIPKPPTRPRSHLRRNQADLVRRAIERNQADLVRRAIERNLADIDDLDTRTGAIQNACVVCHGPFPDHNRQIHSLSGRMTQDCNRYRILYGE